MSDILTYQASNILFKDVKMMNKIILGALGLAVTVAATPLELVERSSCRDDSLYKCFADREYSHSASAYCSALAPVTKAVTIVKPTV